MKILHITLRGPVTDGWNYQDNMLIKYHKKLGHDVYMLTSKWIWGSDGKMHKTDKDRYDDKDGVHFVRIEIKGKDNFQNKFKRFENVYEEIERISPDFIFAHAAQYLDIVEVGKYVRNNPNVRLVVDCHVDFSNSASNWISKNILHRIIWGWHFRYIAKYADHVYGVLPARVEFLKNIYHVDPQKVSLLVMGADDELVEQALLKDNIRSFRNKYEINETDFLIVSGGKIDKAKWQTLLLLEAVAKNKDEKLRLIIFGSVDESIKDRFMQYIDGRRIQYVGWIDSADSYQFFGAADLVVFPGRHSVFWEEVAGMGKPMICKYWEGTTHVDKGGNVRFLYEDTLEAMQDAIEECKEPEKYTYMCKLANENQYTFRYTEISKSCLPDYYDRG
ncbi:MAG: glycosyltransferase family 4 protein [Lachnospiraceae bacterium]|nr:glycosyltransferase family 4 protein [Lachnospiraceae bacterium]